MLTLAIGGARSGKSTHALRLAAEHGGEQVTYIAPCVATDDEMAERVRRHQADRPAEWSTIEEPLDLPKALEQATDAGSQAVVIDCLTLWLYNAMEQGRSDEDILAAACAAAGVAQGLEAHVIAVTNEVGGGIVPASEIGRRFRDLQGRVNQLWAAAAHEVVLVVAGLPMSLKKQGRCEPLL